MSRLRTLVTGVPGWLGSRFVEVLKRGFAGEGAPDPERVVRCLVLPGFNGGPTWASDVEWVEGDLRRPESLAASVAGVDTIFHLAGVIHPRRLRELFVVNAGGTRNILQAAAQSGVRRFVYVSSNSVGGYRRGGELMRESDPPRPYMAYGRSKHAAECAVREFAEGGRLEAVILRPCWYYGPGQPDRQTRFFRMIKGGRPIVFGDGTNLRSLSYVDNVIDALLLAAKTPRANGQVYWIADRRPYPTLEIYRTLAELLEVADFRPRHVPDVVSEGCLAADWLLQRCGWYQQEIHVAAEMNKDIACSIERAADELGYRPSVDLREGMRRSIEWCRRAEIAL